MAATITFSNEKKTGAFEYTDGTYTLTGNATANLVDNVLQSANGQVRKGEDFLGDFWASKAGEEMKVSINNVDANVLASISPVVAACIVKVAAHYK